MVGHFGELMQTICSFLFCAVLAMGGSLSALDRQAAGTGGDISKAGKSMTKHAKGGFDLKMTPTQDKTPDPALGRLLVQKTYHGDIEGNSVGEMLTSGNGTKSGGLRPD
jgi:Protein of unknown function (DUF3224)